MRFAYVLPDPGSYSTWKELDADLACIADAGYDAVELQVADPGQLDEDRLRRCLETVDLPLAAVQTGGTYATRGNCLTSPKAEVRARTVALLRSFVDFASRWGCILVFGSLQGRPSDEPHLETGRTRIMAALREVCDEASRRGAVLALEPVNHLEVGWHTTIAEMAAVVRELDQPGARLMIDSFHMNIEESDMTAPIRPVADMLAHVHLSETNRDVLGNGHWDTAEFLASLEAIGFDGTVSVGVYRSAVPRHSSIRRCMRALQSAQG